MLEREYLARHNPSQRSPRCRERRDKNANKGDSGHLRGDVVHDDVAVRVLAVGEAGATDDELADGHADGAPQQQRAASDLVDGPEAWDGRNDVDGGHDHLDGEGVADTGVLEVSASQVSDPLLPVVPRQRQVGHATHRVP